MFNFNKLLENIDKFDDRVYTENECIKKHIGLLFGYKLDVFDKDVDISLIESLDIDVLDKLDDIVYSFMNPTMLKEKDKIYYEIYMKLLQTSRFEEQIKYVKNNYSATNKNANHYLF